MQIAEPMTMATDYILGTFTLVLANRLYRQSKATGVLSQALWAGGFLSLALASFLGGTEHGFVQYLGNQGDAIVWTLTMLAVGLTGVFLASSAVTATFSSMPRMLLCGLLGCQWAAYAIWILAGHTQFKYAIYEYLPCLIGVLLLLIKEVVTEGKESQPGATRIISGVLISFLAAGIQQSHFTAGKYLNHNDIYHVVQGFAIWLMYRGGLLLKDEAAAPSLNPVRLETTGM